MADVSFNTDNDIIPSPTCSPPRKEESRKKNKRCRIGKTIAVEGNIGCGKTSFLNHFRQYKNVEVFAEPVDKWKDVMGYNALQLMYEDAKRWSFAFQSLVTLSMLEHHCSYKDPSSVKMIERTIYSTRYCFMENLIQSGLMPAVEHAVLMECHKWVDDNEDIDLDLIVYLRASPETCAERIKCRNRVEEEGVPLDYLRTLHRLHDDWLLHRKWGKLPAPVLILDADKDMAELEMEINNIRLDIMCGLNSPELS